jgi:hypothetical protein
MVEPDRRHSPVDGAGHPQSFDKLKRGAALEAATLGYMAAEDAERRNHQIVTAFDERPPGAPLLWICDDDTMIPMKDAIVQEMREIRRQIEREFEHDVNKYLDHVYEAQETHGRRLIHRQPKALKQRKTT